LPLKRKYTDGTTPPCQYQHRPLPGQVLQRSLESERLNPPWPHIQRRQRTLNRWRVRFGQCGYSFNSRGNFRMRVGFNQQAL
jgi:hypothetical protein